MRGIAFALICSLFLNSSAGYQIDNIMSSEDKGAYSYDTTVSENENTVSGTYIETQEITVSDSDIDGENNQKNWEAVKDNYHIVGTTPQGDSFAIKAPETGNVSMPVKPFESSDYDWTAMGIVPDYSMQVEQIKQEMITEEGRIYVSSEKDMLALAFLSDQGETFKDFEIIQTEDITFTHTFPGIGCIDTVAGIYGFEGTFDGNGYVFYGLKQIADRGIFPTIGRRGIVRNVTLLAGNLILKKGEVEFFCPLTERNLGLIENYYLEGNIAAEQGISVWGCGWLNLGILRDSTVKGNIVAASAFNGFFLFNRAGAQILNCYNHCNVESGGACGIAGESQGLILQMSEEEPELVEVAVTIENIEYYPREFFPSITSEEVKSYYDETKDITIYYITPLIKDCYNYGNITSEWGGISGIVGTISPVGYAFIEEENNEIVDIYSGDLYAGYAIVEHCVNYGNIAGDMSVAGIVAQFGELVADCVNYGTIDGSWQVGGIGGTSSTGASMEPQFGIVSSVNYGDIIGAYAAGGIFGSSNGILEDNYNRGNIRFNEKKKEAVGERIIYALGGLVGTIFEDKYRLARGYSTGDVEVVTERCNGLIGYLRRNDYPENFYLTGNMEGVESQQGYVTEEWLKSEEALTSLGSAFQKDIYGVNDGYPILKWQMPKTNKMQVRFVTFGGSQIEPWYLYGGEQVSEPTAPVRDGAEFEGWYTDASYTTKWDFTQPVTSSMSLYAKWKDPLKKQRYKVTFDTDGGFYDLPYGFSEYVYVWEGSTLEDFDLPIKEEYSFCGWGINGSTTDFWDLEKDRVTEDVVLKAIWKEEGLIVVRMYHGGADGALYGYDYDWVYRSYAGKFDFETIISKKGYDFAGWFTEENGKGKEYTSDTRIYGDIDLYAYWISKERYQVTFDSCGGNEITAIEGIIPGNSIEMPVPVKENCVFMGWYTKPEGQGVRFHKESAITKNMTLYAYWQEDIVSDEYHIKALENQIYTGSKVMPEVEISYKNELLIKDKDYTLTYVNCVSAGTAKVHIRIKDNNKKFTLKYQIIEKNLEDRDIFCKVYSSHIDSKTGLLKIPVIEVSYLGQMLEKNKDYSIEMKEDEAAIVLTGKGSFVGKRVIYFKIKDNSIADVAVGKISKQSYTGEEIRPRIEITAKDGEILTAGKDYECVYTNNINPGKATIEIRGIGSYGGSRKVNFVISKKALSEQDVEVDMVLSQVYDGMAKQPQVTVSCNNIILEQGKDYTVKYSNHKNVSDKACVTIKGKGNYSGQRKEYFEITQKVIKGVSVTVEDGLYRNGKEVKPKVVVKDGTITLRKNKDYTLYYSNNQEIGNGTVSVYGIGNYTGETKEYSFRIVSEYITKAKVNKISPVTYCGNSFRPKVEVYYKNELLTEQKDYILEYPEAENISAGKGSLYIVGQGIYGGKKKVTYVINKKSLSLEGDEFSLQTVEPQKYTGTKVTPKISISYNGIALEEGKDYKLRYQNNVNSGNKAKIIIQGIGNYKGTLKTDFTILPADITDTVIEAQDAAYREGKNCRPKVVVKYGNKKLKEKKDYLVIYDSNVQCQDGVVSVKGIGNFEGAGEEVVKVPYHVYEVAIGKVKCQKLMNPMIVNDEILEPDIRLSYQNVVLKEDIDYILKYENNTKPGKAKVIIHGIGRFGGTKTITFQIKKK